MSEELYTAPTILVETVGVFETNCYYVFSRDNGPLFIIDPGADAEKLYDNATRFGANVGLGAECYVSDVITVGLEVKYNAIKDFDAAMLGVRVGYTF